MYAYHNLIVSHVLCSAEYVLLGGYRKVPEPSYMLGNLILIKETGSKYSSNLFFNVYENTKFKHENLLRNAYKLF
jgi:hypothetical protein